MISSGTYILRIRTSSLRRRSAAKAKMSPEMATAAQRRLTRCPLRLDDQPVIRQELRDLFSCLRQQELGDVCEHGEAKAYGGVRTL